MAANTGAYDLLKPSRVAEMLDVDEETLKRWRSNDVGPRHVKLVGGIRYRKSDIESYIEENTRSGTKG
jgi:predicted site-specific integrase-resolvase